MRRLSLCAAVLIASIASRASAALEYFAWNPVTPTTYTATAGGIAGTLSFSRSANEAILRNDVPPTAPNFIATYGPTVPAIAINDGVGGSAANATAAIQFDAPLPAGSRLIAFDVDAGGPVNEHVQFTQAPGTLTLIDQLESQAGASSLFPTWSAVSGTLTAQRLNDEEASVFDVSGIQSLSITYLRNANSGGITGARFSIALPVPEPASCLLLAAALPAALLRRTKRVGQ